MRSPPSTPTGEHQGVDLHQDKRNKKRKNKEKQLNVKEANVNHLIYD